MLLRAVLLIATVALPFADARAQSASPTGPGIVVNGSPDVSVGGASAARQGDASKDGPVVQGSPDVFINGHPAATAGGKTACGGVVVGGASNVFINGKPSRAAATRRRAARRNRTAALFFHAAASSAISAVMRDQGTWMSPSSSLRDQPGFDKNRDVGVNAAIVAVEMSGERANRRGPQMPQGAQQRPAIGRQDFQQSIHALERESGARGLGLAAIEATRHFPGVGEKRIDVPDVQSDFLHRFHLLFHVVHKIEDQGFKCGEAIAFFSSSVMPTIALSSFIVISDDYVSRRSASE